MNARKCHSVAFPAYFYFNHYLCISILMLFFFFVFVVVVVVLWVFFFKFISKDTQYDFPGYLHLNFYLYISIFMFCSNLYVKIPRNAIVWHFLGIFICIFTCVISILNVLFNIINDDRQEMTQSGSTAQTVTLPYNDTDDCTESLSDWPTSSCRTLSIDPLLGAGSISSSLHISGYKSTDLIGSAMYPVLKAGPEATNNGYKSWSLFGS